MKFCSLVLELHLPQNFCHTHTDTQTHRHTDRHFPEIVKSCSGHPKTCKSIKNRKSKIFTKPILSSTYIEESWKIIFIFFYVLLIYFSFSIQIYKILHFKTSSQTGLHTRERSYNVLRIFSSCEINLIFTSK